MKFQGLINVSGFHVDPGYNGKLIYAVYNASPSPIQICENDNIFKIWFCDIDRTSERTYPGRPYDDIPSDIIKGMNKEIYSLQSVADKIRDLENTIDARLAGLQPTIDNLTFIWRAIIVGVVLAFLALAYGPSHKVSNSQASGPATLPPSQPSSPPSPTVPQ
jgi:dCTP deaminase